MARAQGRPTPTAIRLDRFLADHPDAAGLSLAEIGRQLDVSRQRVRALLPDRTDRREQELVERVRRWMRKHPDPTRSGRSGGQTWKAIGAELSMPAGTVQRIWRKLGLPERRLSTDEELGARRAARQQQRNRRVLREEQCLVCQRPFLWTIVMERGRRYQGRAVTCSTACTLQMRSGDNDPS